MAGDRSNYRDIYPEIIMSYDNQKLSDEISPSLMIDIKMIRAGIPFFGIKWPAKILEEVIKLNFSLCMDRILMGAILYEEAKVYAISYLGKETAEKYITLTLKNDREFVSNFQNMGQIAKEYLYEFPAKRITYSKSWKKPFDAMSPLPKVLTTDVPDNILDEMHEYINRAHDWFGVGEWNISLILYIDALRIALGSYNLDAVEMITRFLVDTYIAAGYIDSAIALTDDFLTSVAFQPKRETKTHEQMIESVLIGLAIINDWEHYHYWYLKYKKLLIDKQKSLNKHIEKWNIVELLIDVYTYKENDYYIKYLNTLISTIKEKIEEIEINMATTKSETTQTPTVITLSATSLYQAYDANEISANKKYLGKEIIVSGIVERVANDKSNRVLIVDLRRNIRCKFEYKHGKDLSNLVKGEKVAIQGICQGKERSLIIIHGQKVLKSK